MRSAVVVLMACSGAATINPTVTARLPVRADAGVVSLDGATFAFNDAEVSIVRAGAITSVTRASGPWGNVTTLAAPDRTRWVVGVANAQLWRVTSTGEIEEVGSRLGVAGHRVLSVAASRGTFVVGLEKGVLVSRDSRHAIAIDGSPAVFVAASLERVAIGREGAVELLDLVRGTRTAYTLPGVVAVEFTDRSTTRARLVVSTREGVLTERGSKLVRVDGPRGVRKIAAAGERLWMLGETLGVRGPSGLQPVTVAITPATRLHAAADGGVWLADGPSLVHITPTKEDPAGWTQTVAPLFRKTCARCHLPDGAADVDLSTAAAWSTNRDALRRVLEQRSMPPDTPLDDGDRATIELWLDR